MDRKALLSDVKRVVVKIGTSSITAGGSAVSEEFMDSIAGQVSELRKRGIEVLLVSSGAIGIGLKALNAVPKPNEVPIKQAAASVGQGILMQKWNDSFQKYGMNAAQVLITMADYSDREKVMNLNNTITTLLEYGAVPIFNENDAIAVKEIGPVFGDNDTLSAVIASRADADLLVIMSDIDGLYDSNPRTHPDAKFISEVSDIESVEAFAGGAGSRRGTGGMRTKLQAADLATAQGIDTYVINGSNPSLLYDLIEGKSVGTKFKAG